MSLTLNSLFNAASRTVSTFSDEKSVLEFLNTISKSGIQVKSRFEANFSGLQDATFYIQSVNVPRLRLNTAECSYAGRTIAVPAQTEHEHDVMLTVLNDATGYIYAGFRDFVTTGLQQAVSSNGYTITIKTLGDKSSTQNKLNSFVDKTFGLEADGADFSLITLENVFITSVGELDFSYSDSSVSTFNVGLYCRSVSIAPGKTLSRTQAVGSIVNAVLGAVD